MKLFKYLALIFIFLCSFFVSSQRLYNNDDILELRPKKAIKFNLNKHSNTISDSTIFSDSVYFLQSEFLCADKCDSLYTILKFYKDGDVFISYPYLSRPSKQDFRDTSYGILGKYSLINRKLKVEFFMNKQEGLTLIYGDYHAQSIQFYMSSASGFFGLFRRSISRDNGVYLKIVI
jgi:hypothetical protein